MIDDLESTHLAARLSGGPYTLGRIDRVPKTDLKKTVIDAFQSREGPSDSLLHHAPGPRDCLRRKPEQRSAFAGRQTPGRVIRGLAGPEARSRNPRAESLDRSSGPSTSRPQSECRAAIRPGR